MSHAGQTLHYQLPQYAGTDIINPLVDTNDAYEKIDKAIYDVASSAATAVQTAQEVKEEIEGTGGVDSRISALVTRVDAVETKNVEQDTAILGVQQALATTNGNVATNTQNISDLGTTVSGHTTAISTLNTKVQACENADAALDVRVTALENAPTPSMPSAADVSFDNTTSGMSATNVQAAIDELHDADGIAYDNASSGLNATDVQSAIDEVNSKFNAVTPDVTVTGDGVKTLKTLLTELADSVDFTKLNQRSIYFCKWGANTFNVDIHEFRDGLIEASWVQISSSNVWLRGMKAYSTSSGNSSLAMMANITGSTCSATDESNMVVGNGDTLNIIY